MENKHHQIKCVLVALSYLTLCDPMDCSPPGFSVHGISQAKILEWVAVSAFIVELTCSENLLQLLTVHHSKGHCLTRVLRHPGLYVKDNQLKLASGRAESRGLGCVIGVPFF